MASKWALEQRDIQPHDRVDLPMRPSLRKRTRQKTRILGNVATHRAAADRKAVSRHRARLAADSRRANR